MPCSRSLALPARTIWVRPIFVMVLARKRRQLTSTRSCRGTAKLGCRRDSPAMDGVAIAWMASGRCHLTELRTITSADLAAIWAQEALPAKNSLTAADAKLVEDAFERRLSELARSATAETADGAAPSTDVDLVGAHAVLTKGGGDLDQPDGIDTSGLVTARPRRYRNPAHLRYVPTTVSHLRPQTIRSASSSLPTTASARSQSERRIRRPALPLASPRGSSRRRRAGLVEGGRHRSR